MRVLTTSQVAKICHVATRTVSNWFDSGRLKGYRIPGSAHRRVPLHYLIEFLKENRMPLGGLAAQVTTQILVLSKDLDLIASLRREFPAGGSYEIAAVASEFDAGFQAQGVPPACVLIDFSIGRAESLRICERLRRNSRSADAVLVAILPDNGLKPAPGHLPVNEVFKRPFDTALLAGRLRTLLAGKTRRG